MMHVSSHSQLSYTCIHLSCLILSFWTRNAQRRTESVSLCLCLSPSPSLSLSEAGERVFRLLLSFHCSSRDTYPHSESLSYRPSISITLHRHKVRRVEGIHQRGTRLCHRIVLVSHVCDFCVYFFMW